MMRRPEQIRLEVAWHEAAHCAVAWILGRRDFERVYIVRPGETREQGELAGCVKFSRGTIEGVYQAADEVCVLLAGEAGVRCCWALGVVTDEELGGETVPADELSVEDILVPENGRTPSYRVAYRPEHPDEVHARELCDYFSAEQIEAAALMGWCRARTANLVQSDRCQYLISQIAAALLDHNELDGALMAHLLERADSVYRLTIATKEENDATNQG